MWPARSARHPGQDGPAGCQRSQEPGLALEQRRRLLAPIGPPAMQLRRRQGVKRPGADLLPQAEPAKPLLQFAGGLAGEGHGQGVAWVGRARCGPGRRSGASAPGSCPRRPMPAGTAGPPRRSPQPAGRGSARPAGLRRRYPTPPGLHRSGRYEPGVTGWWMPVAMRATGRGGSPSDERGSGSRLADDPPEPSSRRCNRSL